MFKLNWTWCSGTYLSSSQSREPCSEQCQQPLSGHLAIHSPSKLQQGVPSGRNTDSSSSDVEVLLAIQPLRQTTPPLWGASLNLKVGQLLLQTAHTEPYWGISTHIFNFLFTCTLILGWVSIPFSRGSSQSRDRTQVSSIASRFFYCPIYQASSERKLTENKKISSSELYSLTWQIHSSWLLLLSHFSHVRLCATP